MNNHRNDLNIGFNVQVAEEDIVDIEFFIVYFSI